jgi:hypothetical protein
MAVVPKVSPKDWIKIEKDGIVDAVVSGIKPRYCSSHLLRLANPCCNACFTILFLNIINDYACVTKSLQLRFSLRFAAPRYDAYCKIWVKDEWKIEIVCLLSPSNKHHILRPLKHSIFDIKCFEEITESV